MEDQLSLLHRYRRDRRDRRDRRKLLQFLLSSSFSSAASASSLSHVNFDTLSADYVIGCVKSGAALDISEATKKYFHESSYPPMTSLKLGDSFFLRTDPDDSGSPPRRPPPSISSRQSRSLKVQNTERIADDRSFKYVPSPSRRPRPVENFEVVSLGLPSLKTGLSDDDLRESAYEVLLASMATSGIVICSIEDQRKHKTSRLLSGLTSRKDKPNVQSQPCDKNLRLIRTIRAQMQISEAMDDCTRQKMMMLSPGKTRVQIDIPQIVLGLLNFTFKSDFSNEKSYMQWKNRQASILEELLCSSPDVVAPDHVTIKRSLARIRNAKEWDFMSSSGRAEVISVIKKAASTLSSLPGRFDLQSETYFWTSGYHLNIRFYEKLLLGVFDVLDEGQLIEEADEFLMLMKLTWSTLGITQKMHDALYLWVLFQQFVGTDEDLLLEHTMVKLQELKSTKVDDENVKLYMNSLLCSIHCNAIEIKLSLVDAVFYSISIWCESKLQDYHLHFSQQHCHLKRVMSLVSAVGVLNFGDGGQMKLRRFNLNKDAAKIVESYMKRSIEAAYRRVASNIDHLSELEKKHPLGVLAIELRLIAERELNVFYPELCKWCPHTGMVAAVMLHQIYWERLKPFLDGVSSLSEDAKAVLPAADLLDHVLTQLYNTGNGDNSEDLHHYPIGEVAKPIILDWVIAQSDRILEWTGRAFNLEKWEPLSSQQKQAASIVEVFRIIEETVDQLFGFHLPMDITHLQALLSVVFHTLDAYVLKLLDQMVEKSCLYPSAPPLTRYKEETTIPVLKKKFLECTPLDKKVHNKLNMLTVPKLCVRINTLKYIQKQIDILEDGIRKSWVLVRQPIHKTCAEEQHLGPSGCNDQIDELFSTTFDIIRDSAANAVSKICDFTGAKAVFWDLRHAFLFGLYCGSVEASRLDGVLICIDTVLSDVCSFIDESLRDAVVFSICRASLECFACVLLDGGPSRAFCDSDIVLIEDDLSALKDFFVAEGEGLPRSVVEQEAKFPEGILNLYSLQTETVIQKLMAASEHISLGLDSHDPNYLRLNNAHTFVRVLCHKKDREASKFLKRQYQLPMSSEYEDTPSTNPTSQSPLRSDLTKRNMSDIAKRTTSFRWDSTNSTFTSFKKKLQEATSELRNVAW